MTYTPELWDAIVRELHNGGCPVLRDHAYKISPIGLAIESVPGLNFSKAVFLKDGGTGYAIDLAIRNESIRAIDITGFQIRTPWGITKTSLLLPEKRSSNRYGNYCFPDGSHYPDDMVLNRHVARRKNRLNPRDEIEGLLLVSSGESMPAEIGHLAPIFVTLTIFDSRQNEFSAQFGLRVHRLDILARESAERHARAEAENTNARSCLPARSLVAVAPPAPQEPNQEELAKMLLDHFERAAAIKAKHEHRSNKRRTEVPLDAKTGKAQPVKA